MSKKTTILVILLLLLCLSCIGGAAGELLSESSAAGRIYDACPWQDEIAVLGRTGVWAYRPETGDLTEILDFSMLPEGTIAAPGYPDHIFSAQGKIYILNSRSGKFYVIGGRTAEECLEDAETIFSYDDQGEIRRKELISSIPAMDGVFLLLSSMTYEDGQVFELYHIDPSSDAVTMYGKQNISILYSCTGSQLLAGQMQADDSGQLLYLFDPEKQAFIPLNDTVYSPDTTGFVLNGEQLCYMEDGGQLIIETDGSQATAAYIPYDVLYSSARAFVLNDTYAYLQDYVLNFRKIETNPESFVTLRVLGGVDNRIVRQYMAEHPNINVVFDYRADSFMGLQDALMSRDSGVDLFLVESDGIYMESLTKGYAAQITGSEHLAKHFSSFFPWARDILMPDGNVYAIPVSVDSEYWTINRSMWQKLGLGLYPRCYDDVFSAMGTWNDLYAEDYPEYSLFESMDNLEGMLKTIIRQFLLIHEDWTAPVNFDTEEFRSAVQDTLDHKEIFDYDGESLPLIMNYPQYLGLGYNDADVVESFLPPTLTPDSEQAVKGIMEVLMLSPFSIHSREAVDFMEYYVDHLDTRTAYMLDASRTEPLRAEGYQTEIERLSVRIAAVTAKIESTDDEETAVTLGRELASLQEMLEDTESQWVVSPDDIEIYRKIAEKTIIPTRTIYPERDGIYSEVFDDAIELYVTDSFSTDEFISLLNEKSRQIFAEFN